MSIRLAISAVLAVASLAQAASPALRRVVPSGGQRGTEVEVTFIGDRLGDIEEVMFYEPGFAVTEIKNVDGKSAKAKIKIESATLGEHRLRLRTKSGISDLRTFFVGAYPFAAESEPNNEFSKPQKIALNTTITGTITNEDVDHFIVEVKKGQRLTAEVEGMRLGCAMFDPYVAILDAKRFELAACDDSALALQDPVASVIVPEDGQYIIQVRESAYGGSGDSAYRLHVGTFPRPRVAYPLGGQAGAELPVTFLGDVAGPIKQVIKLESQGVSEMPVHAVVDGQVSPTPNKIRVSSFGNAMEAEPNNDAQAATVYSGDLPIALNGILETPGDMDFFKIKAKKGIAYDITVHARSLRSPVDSVLNVIDPTGKMQALNNDDNRMPDSYLRFSPPNDGEYIVRIRDHLRRGGADFAYRIEIVPAKPDVKLAIPEMVQYTQERQAVAVPRGNRFGALIRATRQNIGGELKVSASDLPVGVKLVSELIPAGADTFAAVFEAAADAPLAGKLSRLTATTTDPKNVASGSYEQTVELIYGQPNNTPYYDTTVDRLAVAVTHESPFSLSIVQPKVPIVQGGSMSLKVKATRKEGFKAPITVRMLFNPPGLNSGATAVIPEGKDEAALSISAGEGAPLTTWRLAVIGSADVKGPLWVSTPVAELAVAAPFLAMKAEPASVERGKETKLVFNIEQKSPFEGKAKVHLGGLPANVTAEDVEITSKDAKLEFAIKTTDKAPPGQHKSLICQVVVTKDSEPITHVLGRGAALRIDAPLVKDDKKEPTTKPAKKEAGK